VEIDLHVTVGVGRNPERPEIDSLQAVRVEEDGHLLERQVAVGEHRRHVE
jgi:hypothetical protein